VRGLIYASLVLNILVLVPVCYGLLSSGSEAAFGPASPAKGILLSVYGAILICSIGLMIKPIPAMVASLLIVQIIYKLTTPFTVGSAAHPVVMSNLAIAAFHCITLWAIWKGSVS
jgi:hypothetical protein